VLVFVLDRETLSMEIIGSYYSVGSLIFMVKGSSKLGKKQITNYTVPRNHSSTYTNDRIICPLYKCLSIEFFPFFLVPLFFVFFCFALSPLKTTSFVDDPLSFLV